MEDRDCKSQINSEISVDLGTYFFVPATKFLDDSNLSLNENEYNLNPYSQVTKQTVKTNASSIAAV